MTSSVPNPMGHLMTKEDIVTIMRGTRWNGHCAEEEAWREKQPVCRLGHDGTAQTRPRTLTIPYSNPALRPDLIGGCDLRIHDIIRIYCWYSRPILLPRFFLQCGWWPFWEKQPRRPTSPSQLWASGGIWRYHLRQKTKIHQYGGPDNVCSFLVSPESFASSFTWAANLFLLLGGWCSEQPNWWLRIRSGVYCAEPGCHTAGTTAHGQ